MVRKLALAVSLALGTVTVPAYALGLGELSSKSTLNQNFNGEISLLSVNSDEIGSVRVRLADAEAFGRAGIDRPFYLSLLKFEPVLDKRGKPIVRITSDFPIREPFMNFLVEVDWPRGRLMREFTVLLDPPTTTKRRAPVVKPAQTAAKPQTSAPSAPAKAAPVKAQPSKASGTAAASAPTAASTAGEYGPVKANDTAWRIASKTKPGGVSIEQMMMALLEANPDAFIDNDINKLRRGRILRIPSLDEIQRMSRAEARAAYRAQQDRWLAQRNEKLQPATPAAADAADAADAGAEPAAASVTGGGADSDASDQLRIATARPKGEGEAGAGDDNATAPQATDLKARLIAARENAESSRQEAETLRTQVDDLQDRLENMQRLLSLKDEQLAQLQDRVVTEDAAPAQDAVPPVLPLPTEASAPADDIVMGNQAVIDDAAETVAPVEQATPAELTVGDVAADAGERVEAVSKAVDDAVAELLSGGAAADDATPVVEVETRQDAVADATSAAEQTLPAVMDLEMPSQIDPDRIVLGLDSASETPAAPVEESSMSTAEPASEGNEVVIDGAPAAETIVMADAPAEPAATSGVPAGGMSASEPAPAAEPAPTPVVADEPVAAPAEDSSLPSMVEQNIVPIAVGGVGLLGLLGWLFTRRRRTVESDDDDAMTLVAAGAGTAAAATADVNAGTAQETPAVDEPILDADALDDLPDSTFLDDFAPSDINALQDETGEVDPVSEADVYIAYGRYQQAEELLKQAMQRDPDRLALKHKLLEVHYATRNGAAFTALAQEMVDSGQDAVDEDAWSRAKDMGHELAPDNPLFERDENASWKAGAATAVTAAAGAAVDDDTLSLEDLELSELNAAYQEDASVLTELEPASEVSISLDLDDNSDFNAPPEPAAPQPVSLDNLEPLDFEMPDADKGFAEGGDEDTINDTLDLDSMMAEAEAAVDQGESTLSLDSDFSAAELQAQLDELSDLSALDSDLGPGANAAPASGGTPGLVAEDTGVAEVGLDEPLSLDMAFDSEGSEEDSLGDLDLDSAPDSEDDVGTKLDLARAYVEMGDQEGARSILEEVVAEGDDGQRDDAEKLLSQLG